MQLVSVGKLFLVAVLVLGVVASAFPAYLGYATDAVDRGPDTLGDSASSGMKGESYDDEAVEQAFVEYLNEARSEENIREIRQNDQLAHLAEEHSEDMAAAEDLNHTNSSGYNVEDRYRAHSLLPQCELSAGGNRYYPGAEVVAYLPDATGVATFSEEQFRISTEEDLAYALFLTWMESDEHRKILMLRSASTVGLSFETTDSGEVYATADFC